MVPHLLQKRSQNPFRGLQDPPLPAPTLSLVFCLSSFLEACQPHCLPGSSLTTAGTILPQELYMVSLVETLCTQVFAGLTPSPPLGLCSNATFPGKLSLLAQLKITTP